MAVLAIEVEGLMREVAVVHHRPLVRAMALVCGDVSDGEDAVQEAFVSLWQALSRGEVIASPRSWLTTASMNRVRSGWRRGMVRTRYLRQCDDGRWAEPRPQ